MRDRILESDRADSSTTGTILMVATAVLVAGVLGTAVLDVAGVLEEPAPEVAVDAEFEARDTVDPHWVFEITHEAGDTVDADELTIRLVDNFGGTAERTYPRTFASGETIQAGLWGSPSRASGANCLAGPNMPNGNNDQLDGFNDPKHASIVRVVVVHEPSNSVMDRHTIELGEMPRRFTGQERHYIVDGSKQSYNCGDVTF